jgi:hypothetical protein
MRLELETDTADRLATQYILGLIITDPDLAAKEFCRNGDLSMTYPSISRVVRRVPGGFSSSYFEQYLGEDNLVDKGTMLLLDISREFQKRLCRCALPSCSLFFFEIRGGGRHSRKYCGKEHREEAHTMGAAARSARVRAGVRIRKSSKPK